jgi:hypothetical protein
MYSPTLLVKPNFDKTDSTAAVKEFKQPISKEKRGRNGRGMQHELQH